MIVFLYVALLVFLVPLQITLAEYISLGGVKPDLCLVATCLVGFLAGRAKGFGVGVGLGFIQDTFSAGWVGLNMITKGLAGIVAGTAAKTLSNTTSHAIFLPTLVLSFVCGLVSLISARPQVNWMLLIHEFRSLLLPQALFDALIAFGVNWCMTRFRSVNLVVTSSSLR